jgi:zinc D-Ala-D-Ala carboxypeptidase
MNHKWTYFKQEEVEGLEDEFIAKLEMARKIAGVPFIITSGKRLPENNATVGGVQDSAHLQGRAVDLRSGDSHSHFRIIKGALEAGLNRIGYYTDRLGQPTHVHLDDSAALPAEVIWYGISH